jgi:hypothetical protein
MLAPLRSRFIAVFLAAAGGVVASPVGAVDSKTSGQIKSVLELYTSQGCSSCPAADKLLPAFADKDGVLALSFNVDIWDSLGWKDTLAKPQFTQRQRAYAQMRGDGQVYTPQTIVNGMTHAVGSDRAAIEAEIRTTSAQTKNMRVPLNIASDGNGVQIDAPTWSVAKAAAVTATLWLVKFTPSVEVAIPRGENSGRKISYHNVVRELVAVGQWRGEASTSKLSKDVLSGCTPGTCAILLQQGGTGSILGAAWVPGVSGT